MAEFPEELFYSTLTELNGRLLAREFTAEQLAKAYCERLEKRGPRLNALALMLRDEAVRKAKDADRELKRGRTRGVLQGIPYAVKDLMSVAGKRTTWGAKPYAEQVLDVTATPIAKLAKSGAALCGKLAMVELAGGGGYRYAKASLTGPGLNPWDRTKWAGGSSSGTAAAVAAGLVPFALGSETNGSIVTPAAFCGVTALRPTYGLVSRYGSMALAWTLDKIGPFARSAEDCGQILDKISGGDSQDPGSAGRGFYYRPELTPALKEMRLGFAIEDVEEAADAPLRPVLLEALTNLRDLGVQMKPASLPDYPYGALVSTIISAEGSNVFRELIESGQVDQLADARQIAGLRAGLEVTASDYLHAMRIRRDIQAKFAELFREFDILVAPARFSTAPPVEEPLDRPSGRTPAGQNRGLRSLIPAGNLAGLPALVLPCGFAEGLPVAIQLVGRPFSENSLLRIGREYQRQTSWHKRIPVL